MKPCYPILNCLWVILLTSCVSYRYIDIQVVNPASISLPVKPSELIILIPNLKKNTNDSISKNLITTKIYLKTLNSMSLALKRHITQSPLFQNTPICFIENYESLDSIKKTSTALENKEKLVLKVQFRILIDTSAPPSGLNIIFRNYYFCYNKFQFELTPLKTKEVLDWHQISTRNASDVIIQNCENVAESYTHRIAPYWSTEERKLYYSSNHIMRKGYNLLCENDLEGSINVWKQLFEIGTYRLSSMAAYNIALAYEMLDDIDSSEKWLINSIQKKPTNEANTYLENIRKRKLIRINLEKQVR